MAERSRRQLLTDRFGRRRGRLPANGGGFCCAPSPNPPMKHWFKDQHFRSLLKNSSYLAASQDRRGDRAARDACARAHALGRAAVRRADPDRQLRQGGQRHRQVPVVAADRPLRRQRRSTASTRISRPRPASPSRSTRSAASAACSSRSRSCRSSPPGSASSPTSCGWRCSTARCFRPWPRRRPTGVLRALDRFDLISWADTVDSDHPGDPASPIAYRRWRAVRRLRRRLVRHRPRGRPLRLVPRVARASAARPARGNSADAAPETPARRLALRDPRQPHRERPGGVGPDRPSRRRRPARAAGAALFRVASSPVGQRAQAGGPARQGLLSGSRPHGPVEQEAVEADASRHRAGERRRAHCDPDPAARRTSRSSRSCSARTFLGAYDALVILMVVPFLSVFSFPLPPMLYALDRPDGPFKARLVGSASFFSSSRRCAGGSA